LREKRIDYLPGSGVGAANASRPAPKKRARMDLVKYIMAESKCICGKEQKYS
jgi:hypothetical protein